MYISATIETENEIFILDNNMDKKILEQEVDKIWVDYDNAYLYTYELQSLVYYAPDFWEYVDVATSTLTLDDVLNMLLWTEEDFRDYFAD